MARENIQGICVAAAAINLIILAALLMDKNSHRLTMRPQILPMVSGYKHKGRNVALETISRVYRAQTPD